MNYHFSKNNSLKILHFVYDDIDLTSGELEEIRQKERKNPVMEIFFLPYFFLDTLRCFHVPAIQTQTPLTTLTVHWWLLTHKERVM